MEVSRRYSLKKSQLLRKNKNYQFVYRVGKSYANRMAVLYVLKKSSPTSRIGFVTGKRLGGAVVRNRVKRLFKEAFRLNQAKLAPGCDLVVIGRGPVVGQSQKAVTESFISLCRKAKVLL